MSTYKLRLTHFKDGFYSVEYSYGGLFATWKDIKTFDHDFSKIREEICFGHVMVYERKAEEIKEKFSTIEAVREHEAAEREKAKAWFEEFNANKKNYKSEIDLI